MEGLLVAADMPAKKTGINILYIYIKDDEAETIRGGLRDKGKIFVRMSPLQLVSVTHIYGRYIFTSFLFRSITSLFKPFVFIEDSLLSSFFYLFHLSRCHLYYRYSVTLASPNIRRHFATRFGSSK